MKGQFPSQAKPMELTNSATCPLRPYERVSLSLFHFFVPMYGNTCKGNLAQGCSVGTEGLRTARRASFECNSKRKGKSAVPNKLA